MIENYKGKRAALMSRVSSDEQTKGYSLDVQSDSLRKCCERNGIEIAYEFSEHCSAKDFDRPSFNEFLSYLKKNKNSIDVLLFTTWDRFSRNSLEALSVIKKLKNLGIAVNAIETPLDLSIPDSKLMLALYLAMPEVDNDRRSMKIRGGIRGSLKSGRWCSNAPIGYQNSRDENNKPIIIPNEQAKHIRYIFEQSSKNVSQADIRATLKQRGFNVPRSTLSGILRKHIYIGKILVPRSEEEEETLITGIHEPLISEELFYKVQHIIEGKAKKNNKPNNARRREELPLRGNLLCSKCGLHLTGSASRGRKGIRYFYYHCNHCKDERFRAEKINNSISNILANLKFSSDNDKLLGAVIEDRLKQKISDINTVEIQKKLSGIQNRLYNLQDHLADNNLSPEEYTTMRGRYELQKQTLEQELKNVSLQTGELKTKLRKYFHVINNLDVMFQNADLANKSKILGSTFPEKLFFDGKKSRTTRINEVIRLLISNDVGFQNEKSGQLSENLELSGLVDSSRQRSNFFINDLEEIVEFCLSL